MRGIDGDWTALSPLLDQALSLAVAERREWLDHLRRERPAVADTLQSLLDQQPVLEAAGFLGPAQQPMSLAGFPGQQVGAYTLAAPLGEGGMGTVWLARRSDGRFEGEAAVKFLSPATLGAEGVRRFRREGSLLAQLSHPNIARLLDAGVTTQGIPYLVLEYVDGEPVNRYCERLDLHPEARLRLFLDVAAAVAAAHRQLIVHRDIKPSNVFVRRDGAVKLIDFGVAKLLQAPERTEAATVATAFTPEYAAPEQLRGGPVTTQTDVYALGLLLFELLTGTRPFTPAERLTMLAGGLAPEPPRPTRAARRAGVHAGQLRRDLDHIVAKALSPAPAARYGSVDAFADDIGRYLADEAVSAHAPSVTYRIWKLCRRHRAAALAATVTLSSLLAATVTTSLSSMAAQRERDEARLQLRRAQATNDFVTSLLSQAGPGGRGLTPVELLDRGMESIRARYEDDPRFAVEMLLVLSGRYMDLGRSDKEYQALLDAEALARRSGDAESLLNVLCNTIESDVFAGRRAEAEARMIEVRHLIDRAPPRNPLVEVDCLRQEAALLKRDDIGSAIARLEQAKTLLEAHGRVHGNVYSSLFSWLAGFNREAGQALAAHRYHEQDLAVHAQQGRTRTVAAMAARAALARSWYDLGEVRRAFALYEAEDAAGGLPALLELSPFVAIDYGLVASALERHTQGLTAIERGLAAARAGNQRRWLRRGLHARALALLRAGRLDDAAAASAAYGAAFDDSVGTDEHALRLALQAEILLAGGRTAEALAAADQALRITGHPVAPLGSLPAPSLVLRSRIQLRLGNAEAARTDAAAALALLETDVADPDRSATVGAARLALAAATVADGESVAAQPHIEAAYASLAAGLGPGHSGTMAALALKANTP